METITENEKNYLVASNTEFLHGIAIFVIWGVVFPGKYKLIDFFICLFFTDSLVYYLYLIIA
jgi:hypothetical protein